MDPITREQLVSIMPECDHVIDAYIAHLNEAFERFEINTPERVSAFVAQTGHESTRYTRIEENLNYSANGLLRTFPNYFSPETAPLFAYKPQKIANRIYANRGGNGNEDSGDGWKFRGRGLIQLTFQRAYMGASKRLTGDAQTFLEDPNLVLQPEWAVRTACDYWDVNNLNDYADRNTDVEFRNLTRKINGGLRGLDDRMDLWGKAKAVFILAGDPNEYMASAETPTGGDDHA